MSKKRIRTLIILAAVLLAVAAVFAAVKLLTKEESAVAEETVTLTAFAADDVEAFEYTYEGAKIAFERSGEGFVLKGEKDFPLDKAAVENMLNSICDAVSLRGLDGASDLSDYGLDEGALEISLTVKDSVTTVLLGDHNNQTDTVYALVSGDDTVHMVESSVKEAFKYALSDLMSMDEVPDTGTVKKVSVKGTEDDFSVEYIKDSEGMYLAGTCNYFMDGKALDNAVGQSYLSKAGQLAPSACHMWSPGEAAKSERGFDEPITVTLDCELSVENEEGETEQVMKEVNFFFGDIFEDEDGYSYRYMMFDGSDMIYLIEEYAANAVIFPDKDGMLPTKVADIGMKDIAGAAMTVNGSEYEMAFEHGEEKKAVLDGEEVSYVYAQGFFVDMQALTWEKLPEKKPQLTNNIRFGADLKLESGEKVSITAFEYDANYCAVKVSAREELLLVNIRSIEYIEDSWALMLKNMGK